MFYVVRLTLNVNSRAPIINPNPFGLVLFLRIGFIFPFHPKNISGIGPGELMNMKSAGFWFYLFWFEFSLGNKSGNLSQTRVFAHFSPLAHLAIFIT